MHALAIGNYEERQIPKQRSVGVRERASLWVTVGSQHTWEPEWWREFMRVQNPW